MNMPKILKIQHLYRNGTPDHRQQVCYAADVCIAPEINPKAQDASFYS
jgi:hypothetical protein